MQELNEKELLAAALEMGLKAEEFEMIKVIMGRVPNFTEVSIYGVMWSEHCSYKNSIQLLKTLPRDGSRLLVGAGEENAGLVDIGDGLACAFKIESHNHPSAVEPYQGAATGVGGIHRDIFTMGARPIAALNSLRFGNIDLQRTKHLMKGVVAGISGYGNCLGVPTVGGEVYFDECYNHDILVNAMSVGTVKHDETVSAIALGAGNPVFIVGSATGKDGIHGASFASKDMSDDSTEDLPAVQVGDPFQEKLLLEASLEAIKTGAMVGMQDMGAAGIICSTSEMSAKGEVGMRIDLDKVPTRQKNMKPFEILLSESQERMLIVCHKGRESELTAIFDKWDLECAIIGEVNDTGQLHFIANGEIVADVNADSLVLGGGAPIYTRETKVAAYVAEQDKFDINTIKIPSDLKAIAEQVMTHPSIASKKWIYEQYDSMVRTNSTGTNEASAAVVIRLKNSDKCLAVTTDCNSNYVNADPYKGAMIAVSEAARNIVCSGGLPVAITNCLNFGNPYNPEVYWQFSEAIRGMGDACRKLDTPVTGGNVSFYNQYTQDGKTVPIHPTPTIGMLGLLNNKNERQTTSFKQAGDAIILIGESRDDINQSTYLRYILDERMSPCPYFDMDEEHHLHKTMLALYQEIRPKSVNDVSDGGLFGCLLESSFKHDIGFSIDLDNKFRKDAFLFGESQSRIVITVAQSDKDAVLAFLKKENQAACQIGSTSKATVHVGGEDWGPISHWSELFHTVIHKKMDAQ